MFSFTIRDVLWLTVVVALAVALWQKHLHQSRLSMNYSLLKIDHDTAQEQKAMLGRVVRGLKAELAACEAKSSAPRNHPQPDRRCGERGRI